MSRWEAENLKLLSPIYHKFGALPLTFPGFQISKNYLHQCPSLMEVNVESSVWQLIDLSTQENLSVPQAGFYFSVATLKATLQPGFPLTENL